jgi:hypothetical protein
VPCGERLHHPRIKTHNAQIDGRDVVADISPAGASLPHPLTLILIGGSIGVIYTFYLFPLDFLAGTSPFWQAPPSADLATQLAGARYYIGDGWWFPIFRTIKIAPPDGTSIVYMDTLPFFAVIVKLLRASVSPAWVYFGIWIAVCYVLQAVSSVILIIALGVRSYTASIAIAVIALSAPPFLFRLFHPTLCAHFVVLLALALYFIAIRFGSFHRVWPWFVLLAWLSLWVQAYLFVMVAAIFLATGFEVAVTSRKYRVEACLATIICLAGALTVMWLSGYFWERARVGAWEVGTPAWYGKTSMNLLSPVIPQWSDFFPAVNAVFGATKGAYEGVGVIDATGGQYEGFNYPGAGVLFLLVVALCLDRKKLALRAGKYWGLLAALFGLTALAITHRVYLGGWGIVLFDKVPLVLDEVRSSGRLFWPVGYAVMAYAIAVVVRNCRRLVAIALLLVASSAQVADAARIRRWIQEYTVREYAVQYIIPATPWVDVVRDHRGVSIFPTYACAAESKVWNLIAEIVLHASQSLTPVNTAPIDHFSNVDCGVEARSLRQTTVGDGTLLLLLSPRYIAEFGAGHPEYRQICRSFDKGWACTRHWQRIEDMGWSGPFHQL